MCIEGKTTKKGKWERESERIGKKTRRKSREGESGGEAEREGEGEGKEKEWQEREKGNKKTKLTRTSPNHRHFPDSLRWFQSLFLHLHQSRCPVDVDFNTVTRNILKRREVSDFRVVNVNHFLQTREI